MQPHPAIEPPCDCWCSLGQKLAGTVVSLVSVPYAVVFLWGVKLEVSLRSMLELNMQAFCCPPYGQPNDQRVGRPGSCMVARRAARGLLRRRSHDTAAEASRFLCSNGVPAGCQQSLAAFLWSCTVEK